MMNTVHELARLVKAVGGRAYIVGGWVRDYLLDRPSKDIDVEVFGVNPDALVALLRKVGHVEAVGVQFPVWKVFPPGAAPGDAIDVAIPRRESKSGVGHKGFDVQGDPTMTPAEAVKRRDFTINALMFDPLTDTVLDLVNGETDLRDRVLRVVDRTTFADDSLRVLRGAQFAARFDLRFDPLTFDICQHIDLTDLPSERIWTEFVKMVKAPLPSIGMLHLQLLGSFTQILPEVAALAKTPQDPEWHPEGDVFVHTLRVMDWARTINADLPEPQFLTMMLAAICHDLGKPSTTHRNAEGRWVSPGHEEAGVAPATAVLDRLNVHTIDGYDVRGQVLALVEHHLQPMLFASSKKVGDGAFRRLARKVDLELLGRMALADMKGRGGDTGRADTTVGWFLGRARDLGVQNKPVDPILMGRHVLELGLAPGPLVGKIVAAVYEQQMDGTVTTLDEAKAAARLLIATT